MIADLPNVFFRNFAVFRQCNFRTVGDACPYDLRENAPSVLRTDRYKIHADVIVIYSETPRRFSFLKRIHIHSSSYNQKSAEILPIFYFACCF
jgi:hypothetical protein